MPAFSLEPDAIDPDGVELRAIESFVPLDGRSVLELGCGDGRLTRGYAGRAGRVLAADPDPARIARAHGPPNVEFRVAVPEELDEPDASFDVAIYSWSL